MAVEVEIRGHGDNVAPDGNIAHGTGDVSGEEFNWTKFIKQDFVPTMRSNKVNVRYEFLLEEFVPKLKHYTILSDDASDNSKVVAQAIFKKILSTLYLVSPKWFLVRKLRIALLETLSAIGEKYPKVLVESLTALVVADSDEYYKRSTTSDSDRFRVFKISCELLSAIYRADLLSEVDSDWKSLVGVQSQMSTVLIGSLETNPTKNSSTSMKKSVLANIWRTLRCGNPEKYYQKLFDYLASSSSLHEKGAIVFGSIISTAYRQRNPKYKQFCSEFISNNRAKVIAYIQENILLRNYRLPDASIDAFSDFLRDNMSDYEKDFKGQLQPTFEKAVLKSPELSLRFIRLMIPHFGFGCFQLFTEFLADPLAKKHCLSTNATVKSDAYELWDSVLRIFDTKGGEKELSDLVETTNKVLLDSLLSGKAGSPPNRVIVLQLVKSLVFVSKKTGDTSIVEKLVKLSAKEGNDVALLATLQALGEHLLAFPADKAIAIPGIKEAMLKGLKLADKSEKLRKVWVAQIIGPLFWDADSSVELPDDIANALWSFVEKLKEKPLVYQPGPLEGYVATAIGFRSKKISQKLEKVALELSPKPSYLLWDKVYHKLTSSEEVVWFTRAIEALFARKSPVLFGTEKQSEINSQISNAFIYFLTKRDSDHVIVSQIYTTLKRMNGIDSKRLSATVIPELLRHMDQHIDESKLAKTWFKVLSVLGEFNGKETPENVQDRLIDLGLAAFHPSITGNLNAKYSWVWLIRCADASPEELLYQKFDVIKAKIFEALDTHPDPKSPRNVSALMWVEALAFIGGKDVVSSFIDIASQCIDAEALSNVTPDELGVFYTPEGVLYNHPLKKAEEIEDKNRPDYATEKWERELRASLAKKKEAKAQPKLTKEEKAAVEAQQKLEDEMRAKVNKLASQVTRGLSLIESVVKGNKEVASQFMLSIIRLVVSESIVKGKVGRLVGPKASETLVTVGTAALGLESSLVYTITIATLRALGRDDDVPEEWKVEPLDDLLIRILFKVRMGSEILALSIPAFVYVYPLIQTVIKSNGFGKTVKKTALNAPVAKSDTEYAPENKPYEQITYCTDILSLHVHLADVDKNTFPRSEIAYSLLTVMKNQPQLIQAARTAITKLAETMENTTASDKEKDAFLSGLLYDDEMIRLTSLEALDYVDLTDHDFSEKLWLAICDQSPNLVELALELWQENSMEIRSELIDHVFPYLKFESSLHIRRAASKGIVQAVRSLLDLPLELSNDSEYGIDNQGQGNIKPVKISKDVIPTVQSLVKKLIDLYRTSYISLEVEYDRFGMVVPGTQNKKDPWEARESVAETLRLLAPYLDGEESVVSIIKFLVDGEALGDRQENVREHLLSAGVAIVNIQGSAFTSKLMPIFENYLALPDKGTEAHDRIREGTVILLGGLAQHLAETDKRVTSAVQNLVATLGTPSEPVQSAVANCLPPLVKRLPLKEISALLDSLINTLTTGATYAERRGSAYGLAGVVKGNGLRSIAKFDLIGTLEKAFSDKKNPNSRQGALFALETLPLLMGRLFEPYIPRILPLLLAGFGDASAGVREAATDASRVIMGKLTGYGVKTILPTLLKGTEDNQWRTKKGSVEMLGSMAFCAPKQLSTSLPSVVPEIVSVAADSHMQVASAARQALDNFGKVINNPEIQTLVPHILAALTDPNAKTSAALQSLISTAFVHYIDAPSLALVMPVLHRGMKERQAVVKRQAAQIVGSMTTLTEPKDLIPYLNSLVPLLRKVLIDPVPETRATSAKALGSLVTKLGETRFPGLVGDLLSTLKSDTPGADRSGAAQGLSEILAGIGPQRLDGLMPEIISGCSSTISSVRQGFMTLLIYLPVTFGEPFQPYLPQVLPHILSNLADENEPTRDASLRAGKILVIHYAESSVELFLKELVEALKHSEWRTRQSSVDLLGDLLFRVAGLNSKQAQKSKEAALASSAQKDNDDEEGLEDDDESVEAEIEDLDDAELSDDDNELEDRLDPTVIEQAKKLLGEALGVDRRNQVFAAIYVSRHDVAAMVRHSAVAVWKTLVTNSPRTIKECIEPLMEIILNGLASDSSEYRITCARALGDLVRKLGESVISKMIPILESTLDDPSSSDEARQGACIGLSDILTSAGRTHVEEYAELMTPLVRKGLCDPAPGVREASASAFGALQQAIGPKAIDEIVPHLLSALKKPDQDSTKHFALEALRELMAVKASSVFPVLIPTLTARPISAFHAQALSSLMEVTGASTAGVSSRLPQIVSALFDSLPEHRLSGDKEAEQAVSEAVKTIVAACASDEYALEQLMALFHETVKEPTAAIANKLSKSPDAIRAHYARQIETCHAFKALCTELGANSISRHDDEMGPYVCDWLEEFITLLAKPSEELNKAAWDALDALTKALRKEDYESYVKTVYSAVQAAINASTTSPLVPGFNHAKSIGPLLPILSQGLLTGSPENKEISAKGMGDLIKATPASNLRPYVTGLAGPLIRTIGDRHVPVVKTAILQTLSTLLSAVPALLRPFLPQLQRSFVRCLSDSDVALRGRASKALDTLIPLQPRLDPLITELTTGIKTNLSTNPGDPASIGTIIVMLHAIRTVLKSPGAKSLSEGSFKSIEQAILLANEEGSRSDQRLSHGSGKALGALCAALPPAQGSQLITTHALIDPADSAITMVTKLRVLATVLSEAQSCVMSATTESGEGAVAASILTGLTSKHPEAQLQAVQVAKGTFGMPQFSKDHSEAWDTIAKALLELVSGESSSDVDANTKQSIFTAFKILAKYNYANTVQPFRDQIISSSMLYIRDRMIPLKLAAERCVLYTLRLAGSDGSQDHLNQYVESLGGADNPEAKKLLDYHRRILSKLADATRELDYESDIEEQADMAE
ncbi:translational activator of GCN4 [Mycoemilia scoparia]|uniref:Translational activator of GCN4 n=1 Tax=Mycoemilia scoparia TaxID=417184 RepID=A0A9W8A5U9_9FUNG|nr:translational activator of GCN4 [Mycoemilia scoparia]